jgi:predicted MPP superfamily phosphohydrolase
MKPTMHSLPRLSLFLTVTLSVLFGLHYYIWARLIRDTGILNPWRTGLTCLLVLFGLLVPSGMIFRRSFPTALTTPLLWALYTWLGMAFLLNVLLAVTDLAKLLAITIPLKVTGRALDPERRLFLAQLVGFGVLFANFGMSVAGFRNATASAIHVKRIKVALRNLPESLEGYRIVQVTDIHVGPTIGRDFIQTIVREVNALEPGLVAITGDLVDGTLAQLEDQTAPLKDLRAKDGVFFVTGNHEYYTGDVDEWLQWLSGIGIRPLRNERVAIRDGFDLAGTDDISARGNGHGQDIPKALEGREKGRPVVLMAHQPRSFKEAKRLGVDLQLAGHTHGGQIFPFHYVVALFEPYLAGLYQEGDSQLYVSRGTGYWGPPMRLGAPSEITEVTLSRG